ncbi:MAG TPA: YbhB/YbcL family Raf kinase inhibitor-like protein [Longimicrobiales bacterium]|nr:YbhB/YbcL family Raf kinase inhibitor-like protein [Longimicrobiales bacterium]
MRSRLGGIVALAGLALAACANGREEGRPTMTFATPSFSDGAAMPATYTCDGENKNPGVSWANVPEGAKSLVVLVEDRDAGNFPHWVVFDLPPTVTGIAEGGPPEGGKVGVNGFDKPGYGGPCPPQGRHRYSFNVFALDTVLALPDGATRDQVRGAMKGHVLARGAFMGMYQKGGA